MSWTYPLPYLFYLPNGFRRGRSDQIEWAIAVNWCRRVAPTSIFQVFIFWRQPNLYYFKCM